MHQTLFHIPREAFGLPVFGFGLLLAAWVLGSVAVLAWLIRRQGFNADTRAYLALFALVAAIVWLLLPAMSQSEGLPIRGYGAMIVVAFAAGTGLATWRAWRAGIEPDLIFSLAFWLLVPGIIGARVFYVIEYWPVYREQTNVLALLGAVINIAEGGLVVYGSLFGAGLGLLGFVRVYRLPLLAVCDLIIPSMLLGLALGRIGCLLNGCCYGGPCELDWAITFPPDSPAHAHQVERGETFIHGLKLPHNDPKGPPVIQEVEPGLAAQRPELKPGRVITRINGRDVATVEEAAEGLLRASWISIETDQSPSYVCRWTIEPPAGDRLDVGKIERGEVFVHGLKIAAGPQREPVIRAVQDGSEAEKHGLRAGQQLVKIDGGEVKDVTEAAFALAGAHEIAIRTSHGEQAFQQTPTLLRLGNRPVRAIHPTQIYSSINALLLCLLLLAYAPFCRRDGQLFALALSIYPISRFLLEWIRQDEEFIFGTQMSISQNVSVVLLACTVGLWVYVLRRPPGRSFK